MLDAHDTTLRSGVSFSASRCSATAREIGEALDALKVTPLRKVVS